MRMRNSMHILYNSCVRDGDVWFARVSQSHICTNTFEHITLYVYTAAFFFPDAQKAFDICPYTV